MKPDTKAIRARADKLAPGPWEVTPNLDTSERKGSLGLRDVVAPEVESVIQTDMLEAVAEFIAAARTDVPALCERVEALERALRDILDNSECEGVTRKCQCTHCVARVALEGEP